LNVLKAQRFVEENGTELQKYRLDYLLAKQRDDEVPLRYLRRLQNSDGGFPYGDEEGKLSSINSVSSNLGLMIELGLSDSDVCRKTIDYLMSVQGEDGSWDENEAITQYDPPFWDMPGDLKTAMWLTASILSFLIQLGYGKSEAVRKGVGFLLKHRDEKGKFAGFLHSTWIAVGVFGQLEGIDSDVVRRALSILERNFKLLEDGASDFAWCLESFHVAGMPKEHPLAKMCIDRLTDLQREDGAWTSADGEEYTVAATIGALKALKMYNSL